MSLFDDRGLRLPGPVFLSGLSNGAKMLYMLLLDEFASIKMFGTFYPGDYKNVMQCSNRSLYRYFQELLDSGFIYEERGYFRFRYE